MNEPPVARVVYTPSAPEGEKVTVFPDPILVPRGEHALIWLREQNPGIPWRFSEIEFDRPEVFDRINVNDRVITAIDDNGPDGNQGVIKYTLIIVDETTGQTIVQDPEIQNEFGGGGDPDI